MDPLAQRLDRAYYALTELTSRHFGRAGDGWFLTGVAGLDAPTMNRCVLEDADPHDVEAVLDDAERFFEERDCAWSVVLSSFRPPRLWHNELVMRGMSLTTTLDVLAREPGPLGPVPAVEVREARADEVGRFTDVLMDVFRMPRRFFPALKEMTEAWRDHGARLYFGLEDGEPASTALLATVHGVAGVYNVGTLRHARRRGHARALMARAMEDARDAEVVTLQVSPEGFVERFYLDLGFQPVYQWRFYTPRPRFGVFTR